MPACPIPPCCPVVKCHAALSLQHRAAAAAAVKATPSHHHADAVTALHAAAHHATAKRHCHAAMLQALGEAQGGGGECEHDRAHEDERGGSETFPRSRRGRAPCWTHPPPNHLRHHGRPYTRPHLQLLTPPSFLPFLTSPRPSPPATPSHARCLSLLPLPALLRAAAPLHPLPVWPRRLRHPARPAPAHLLPCALPSPPPHLLPLISSPTPLPSLPSLSAVPRPALPARPSATAVPPPPPPSPMPPRLTPRSGKLPQDGGASGGGYSHGAENAAARP
ncbi:unnamed protein product [Closterium sp. NIES-65]|nr:unnamed protein product [Closterium sp. NIES-65]